MSPYSFYLFKELYKGLTSKQLISQERISQKSLTTILLKLDQLQLIKLHENNRVQITVKGIIRPNLDGDLFQKVIKKQNIDFLETIYENIKDEDCCFQSAEVQLSSKSYKEMIQQIHELGKKFRERSFIESKTFPSKDLTDIRWLFGFLPYKTDWKK